MAVFWLKFVLSFLWASAVEKTISFRSHNHVVILLIVLHTALTIFSQQVTNGSSCRNADS